MVLMASPASVLKCPDCEATLFGSPGNAIAHDTNGTHVFYPDTPVTEDDPLADHIPTEEEKP